MIKRTERRRNIALRGVTEERAEELRGSTKRRYESSDEEEPPQGISPSLLPPPPARNELHPEVLRSESSENFSHRRNEYGELRRSKRLKKKKIDSDFVYTK